MSNKTIKLTLVRSKIGRLKKHKECLKGLGLKKPYQSIEVQDTPETRGMINKVNYMLKIED